MERRKGRQRKIAKGKKGFDRQRHEKKGEFEGEGKGNFSFLRKKKKKKKTSERKRGELVSKKNIQITT